MRRWTRVAGVVVLLAPSSRSARCGMRRLGDDEWACWWVGGSREWRCGAGALAEVKWGGFQGHYGECGVDGFPTATGEQLMALAGSMSTWLVALLATVILWMRRPRGWRRAGACRDELVVDRSVYVPLAKLGRLGALVFWGQSS